MLLLLLCSWRILGRLAICPHGGDLQLEHCSPLTHCHIWRTGGSGHLPPLTNAIRTNACQDWLVDSWRRSAFYAHFLYRPREPFSVCDHLHLHYYIYMRSMYQNPHHLWPSFKPSWRTSCSATRINYLSIRLYLLLYIVSFIEQSLPTYIHRLLCSGCKELSGTGKGVGITLNHSKFCSKNVIIPCIIVVVHKHL